MIQTFRRLKQPATESHLGVALAVAALTMALLLWAVIWQSDVIALQRELIRALWKAQSGG
jgi:hypothetical protein